MGTKLTGQHFFERGFASWPLLFHQKTGQTKLLRRND
jgi:hypothetical protein